MQDPPFQRWQQAPHSMQECRSGANCRSIMCGKSTDLPVIWPQVEDCKVNVRAAVVSNEVLALQRSPVGGTYT